jgi:glycosyl transferase family 25
MNIYCINLDRHPERFRRIETLLNELGVKLSRIRAIDGTRLKDRPHPAKSRSGALPANRTIMSRFEMACVMSHRKAWRTFLKTEDTHCLILEDDVYFGNGFAEFIADPALINSAFDIIKIETVNAEIVLSPFRTERLKARSIQPLLSYHHGAGGYIINRHAAKRLLSLSAGASDGVDTIIFNMKKLKYAGLPTLKIGQLKPAIVIQHVMHKAAAPNPLLDSFIADRRGVRKGRLPVSKSKLLREIYRPIDAILFALRKEVIPFQ